MILEFANMLPLPRLVPPIIMLLHAWTFAAMSPLPIMIDVSRCAGLKEVPMRMLSLV
jgi:hypothetical protein